MGISWPYRSNDDYAAFGQFVDFVDVVDDDDGGGGGGQIWTDRLNGDFFELIQHSKSMTFQGEEYIKRKSINI